MFHPSIWLEVLLYIIKFQVEFRQKFILELGWELLKEPIEEFLEELDNCVNIYLTYNNIIKVIKKLY